MKTRPLAILAVAVACASASASPAFADPPRTCGRIHAHGTLIVRVHQITCRTGLRWARAYTSHHAVPRGYTCSRYTGPTTGIPWVCRSNRVSYREFWVIKPAA